MPTLVPSWEYESNEYELGDKVWFKPDWSSSYVRGTVARVYNSRYDYHVEYDGDRYSTTIDEMHRKNPDADGE
jgi:hypothetical protein